MDPLDQAAVDALYNAAIVSIDIDHLDKNAPLELDLKDINYSLTNCTSNTNSVKFKCVHGHTVLQRAKKHLPNIYRKAMDKAHEVNEKNKSLWVSFFSIFIS